MMLHMWNDNPASLCHVFYKKKKKKFNTWQVAFNIAIGKFHSDPITFLKKV